MKRVYLFLIAAMFLLMSVGSFAATIDYSVDMTVLWGHKLPECVYLYAYDTNFVGFPGTGTYDKNKRGTSNEQTTAGAVKLLPSGDGYYRGSFNIQNNRQFFVTLYVSGKDPNNVVRFPTYETNYNSNDSTYLPINDKDALRTYNSGNGTQTILTAWEGKTERDIVADPSVINTYVGLTHQLTVSSHYNRAKSDFTQYLLNIPNEINYLKETPAFTSDNTAVVTVSATGEITAVGSGTAHIRILRNGVQYSAVTVNVTAPSTTVQNQFIIASPDKGVWNNQPPTYKYELTGLPGYTSFPKAILFNQVYTTDTDTNGVPLFKGLTFAGLNTASQVAFVNRAVSGSSIVYDYSIPGSTRNDGLYIPLTVNPAATTVKNVGLTLKLPLLDINNNVQHDSQGNTILREAVLENFMIPVPFKNFKYKLNSQNANISWTDDLGVQSTYSGTFTKQMVFARISKITTDSNTVKYDPMNMQNGFKSVKVAANVAAFDAGTSNYVDYIFNRTQGSSIVASNGSKITYTPGSFSIEGLIPNNYRIQIYTLMFANNYVVDTMEGEAVFNIPAPDMAVKNNDYFSVTNVKSDQFAAITVEVIIKSSKRFTLTKEDIVYTGNNATVGERKPNENSPNELPSNALGEPVISTDATYKYPLDVVLVLDTSGSMYQYLDWIKQGWQAVQEKLADSDYDVKYRLVRHEHGNDSWDASGSWEDAATMIARLNNSIQNVGDNWARERSDQGIQRGIDLLRAGRGTGGPVAKRWLMFITDSNTNNSPGPDIIQQQIRDNDIAFAGICGVKKDGKINTDDLFYNAEYPTNRDGDNEQHYYHLKMLLGSRFNMYQIAANIHIKEAMLDALGNLGMTKRWYITYRTPFPQKDGTLRQVLFDLKNNNRPGELLQDMSRAEDRQYIAPKVTTIDVSPPFQTLIFKYSTPQAINTSYYELIDPSGQMGTGVYRGLKTVDSPNDINTIISSGTYSDVGIFNFDKTQVLWRYTVDTPVRSLMIKKAIGMGAATLYRTRSMSDKTKLLDYYYEPQIQNLDVTSNTGDTAKFNWKRSAQNTAGQLLYYDKMIFRITKGKEIETRNEQLPEFDNVTCTYQVPKYYFDLYNRQNSLNMLEPNELISSINQDTVYTNTTMNNFLNDTGAKPYVDYVVAEGTSDSLNAGGVGFKYVSGELQVMGLPIGDYTIQVYSLKVGHDSAYRIMNFEGYKFFKMEVPEIASRFINANNLFLIDFIDQSKFPRIQVNFSTKIEQSVDLTAAHVFPEFPVVATNKMTELEKDHNVRLGINAVSSGAVVLRPSDLPGFKYPLDIIFCVDTSGSMGDEIAMVKSKLPWFSGELIRRGFAVRYNLITFGPSGNNISNKWWNKPEVLKENNQTLKTYKNHFFGYNGAEFDTDDQSILMDAVTNANDGIQDALTNIRATSSYPGNPGGSQENGYGATMKAIEKLRTVGRSLTIDKKIRNDNTGPIPSMKWIILISDENYSTEGLTEAQLYGNIVSGVTGVDTSGKPLNICLNNIVRTSTPGRNPPNQPAINVDELNYPSRNSQDIGGPYYPRMKYYLNDDGYNYYELGDNGNHLETSLEAITQNAGIVQRWVLEYDSPFPMPDGTFREVDFLLKNVPVIKRNTQGQEISRKNINPTDVNYDSNNNRINREYQAPDMGPEIIFLDPPEAEQNPVFTKDGLDYVKVSVKARARVVVTLGNGNTAVVEKPIKKIQLQTSEYIAGDGNFKLPSLDSQTLTTEIIPPGSGDDGWYTANIRILKSTLKDSGSKYFDVQAIAMTDTKYSTPKIKKHIKLSENPPKFYKITVENITLKQQLERIMTRNGSGTGLMRLFPDPLPANYSTFTYEWNTSGLAAQSLSDLTGNDFMYTNTIKPILFTNRLQTDPALNNIYGKKGDIYNVTAQIIAEEELRNINGTGNDKTVINATFPEMENDLPMVPQITPIASVATIDGKVAFSYELKWTDLKLKGTKNTAAETLGNAVLKPSMYANGQDDVNTSMFIQSIDIARVDVDRPFVGRSRPNFAFNPLPKNCLPQFDYGITSNSAMSFQVGSMAGNLCDDFGLRAVQIMYDYEYQFSDLTVEPLAANGATGIHLLDSMVDPTGPSPAKERRRFFSVPYDSSGVQNSYSFAMSSIRNSTTNGDNGKYTVYLVGIDYAGNYTVGKWDDASKSYILESTELSSVRVSNSDIYAGTFAYDSIAPVITNQQIVKLQNWDENAAAYTNKPLDGNFMKNHDRWNVIYTGTDRHLTNASGEADKDYFRGPLVKRPGTNADVYIYPNYYDPTTPNNTSDGLSIHGKDVLPPGTDWDPDVSFVGVVTNNSGRISRNLVGGRKGAQLAEVDVGTNGNGQKRVIVMASDVVNNITTVAALTMIDHTIPTVRNVRFIPVEMVGALGTGNNRCVVELPDVGGTTVGAFNFPARSTITGFDTTVWDLQQRTYNATNPLLLRSKFISEEGSNRNVMLNAQGQHNINIFVAYESLLQNGQTGNGIVFDELRVTTTGGVNTNTIPHILDPTWIRNATLPVPLPAPFPTGWTGWTHPNALVGGVATNGWFLGVTSYTPHFNLAKGVVSEPNLNNIFAPLNGQVTANGATYKYPATAANGVIVVAYSRSGVSSSLTANTVCPTNALVYDTMVAPTVGNPTAARVINFNPAGPGGGVATYEASIDFTMIPEVTGVDTYGITSFTANREGAPAVLPTGAIILDATLNANMVIAATPVFRDITSSTLAKNTLFNGATLKRVGEGMIHTIRFDLQQNNPNLGSQAVLNMIVRDHLGNEGTFAVPILLPRTTMINANGSANINAIDANRQKSTTVDMGGNNRVRTTSEGGIRIQSR